MPPVVCQRDAAQICRKTYTAAGLSIHFKFTPIGLFTRYDGAFKILLLLQFMLSAFCTRQAGISQERKVPCRARARARLVMDFLYCDCCWPFSFDGSFSFSFLLYIFGIVKVSGCTNFCSRGMSFAAVHLSRAFYLARNVPTLPFCFSPAAALIIRRFDNHGIIF